MSETPGEHPAPAPAPSGRAGGRWFEPVAEHLGAAYLRYSFTRGTEQEVDFLVGHLGLGPGSRVLDVGCGPGRHSVALARRGVRTVGLDLSATFLQVAAGTGRSGAGAAFVRGDARWLPFGPVFDAVISLCQGGFGLLAGPSEGPGRGAAAAGPDGAALLAMAQALAPGGRLAVTAFSSYFQVRYLEDGDHFDVARGVNHERTQVRSEEGVEAEVDLWTTCFTPRELRLLAGRAGLEVEGLWSVAPGEYAVRPPELDLPEFLLVARRD